MCTVYFMLSMYGGDYLHKVPIDKQYNQNNHTARVPWATSITLKLGPINEHFCIAVIML